MRSIRAWSAPVRVSEGCRWRGRHGRNGASGRRPLVREFLARVLGRSRRDTLGFFVAVGFTFVPFAGLASFLAGTLLWRYFYSPDSPGASGAVCGVLSGVASLAAGAVGFSTIFVVASVADGNVAPVEGVVFWVFLLVTGFTFAMALAGWVVVPLCGVGGWYHERVKNLE